MAPRPQPIPAPPEEDRRPFSGDARFDVVRLLGSGGFGVVYEVHDRERNARVALKALKRSDPAIIYRFKQEFRSLADIVHPNLVQLYELHGKGEQWFFTMELVTGADALVYVRNDARPEAAYAETQLATQSSLPRQAPKPREPTPPTLQARDTPPTLDAPASSALAKAARAEGAAPMSTRAPMSARGAPRAPRRPARFDEARVRSVFSQLVEGIHALHEAGKVHRDIKPSNVLVTPEGRVVLVDFGIAANLSDSSYATHSAILGTPVYMAPEQIRKNVPAPSWDIYAVGVLLYEALTGEPPFDGELIEVLARKQTVDPPPPSALVEGVPDNLDRLCVELLSRVPENRPSTRAILERIGHRRRSSTSVRAAKPHAPFVGREAERGMLLDAFEANQRERVPVLTLVGGPSGVGKSALCRRAREELRDIHADHVVLAGRCYEQESVPYKGVDGLVDSLSRYLKQAEEVEALLPLDIAALARLFPALTQIEAVRDAPQLPSSLDAREQRRSAFDALRELLRNLAQRKALVLFIDDLQWGDADSAALLIHLLEPPDPPPALFVCAYRNDDSLTSPCLRALLPALALMRTSGLRVVEIALDNLPEDDARALARALLSDAGETSEELAAAVARESGGRPFFVDELARFSGDRSPPSRRPTARAAAAAIVSLDEVLRARVAQLPDAARRMLEIVSVAGRPLDRAAAARAAGLGSDEPGAYQLLRGQRLLRHRDADGKDEIETYHDRIREAVTSGISPETRAAHFRSLAEALDGTDLCDREALAVFYSEAGERARAGELTALAAADAANTFAFESAVRLYRRALALISADHPDARALRERLGDALVNAGRGSEAAEALLSAVDGAGPLHAIELRRRGAEQLLISGHTERGLSELHVVLADLRMRLPSGPWQAVRWIALLAIFLLIRGLGFRRRLLSEVPPETLVRIDTCDAVAKSFSLVDTLRGSYFTVRQLTMALAAGEPARILRALALIVGYGGGLGGVEPLFFVRRAAAVGRKIAAEVDDPPGRALFRMCEGVSLFLRGYWKRGIDDLDAAITMFREECTGANWEIDTARQFVLMANCWLGAYKRIATLLPELLADARERGDLYAETIHTLYAGHLPSLARDDPERAEGVLRKTLAAWSQRQFSVQHLYFITAIADTLLYAERGRGARALRQLDELWKDLQRSLLLSFELPAIDTAWARFRALIAFAASDEGTPAERSQAVRAARRIARRLGRYEVGWARALATLARATLASLAGDRATALTELTAAERACEAADIPQYAAAARRRRGDLLGGDEGRALTSVADAWMGAQGVRNASRMFAMLAPGKW